MIIGGCTKNTNQKISGKYYDWTLTNKPERPYIHQYHQTLTIKIDMASSSSKVILTFEDALEVINKIDQLTLGIPKIAYLVGWQHEGHDTGYPDFLRVNDKLKRKSDKTADESLIWLMESAFDYNTTVSFHINLFDAYENSPLWNEYLSNKVIGLDKEGNPLPGEKHGGKQSYGISYYREWETGLLQKRILGLISLVPLKRAGTIHIDAFHSMRPLSIHDLEQKKLYPDGRITYYDDITVGMETETQRKVFRLFRDNGIDVTCEAAIYDLRNDPFIGLQPMAWHFQDIDYMKVPASLYCGGGRNELGNDLFGQSMYGEDIIKQDPDSLKGFLAEFCLQTLPWYYLNRLDRLKFVKRSIGREPYLDGEKVIFSGNVESTRDGIFVNGEMVFDRINGDICMPALWKNYCLMAYSKNGYKNKSWVLPSEWKNVQAVGLYEIKIDGNHKLSSLPVKSNHILLTMQPNQGLMIIPEK
jgi:hypothetical protein